MESKNAKSFFLVEDHEMMQKGLSNFFDQNTQWHCLGNAKSKDEALEFLENAAKSEKLPDVAIIDINLGAGTDGISLIAEIKKRFRSVKSVVYSMFAEASVIDKALENGAKAYVSKAAPATELLKAMEEVMAGKTYIEARLHSPLLIYKNAIASLTKREIEVLHLTLQKLDNAEIAEKLDIQKRSVENYLSHIYIKTDCKTKAELIAQFRNLSGGSDAEIYGGGDNSDALG